MEQTFKIFVVQNEPYLTIDEDVKVGDKAIITVGELYPTLVESQNEEYVWIDNKPVRGITYKGEWGPIVETKNQEVETLLNFKK